jgi:hypothetical protein
MSRDVRDIGQLRMRSADGYRSHLVRAVLDALFLSGGCIGSATQVAARLGLENRFQLTRMLKREGLPPLRALGSWVRVLSWIHHWETDAESLSEQARQAGADPAQYYRCVHRVTGFPWKQARDLGLTSLEQRLLNTVSPVRSETRRFSTTT